MDHELFEELRALVALDPSKTTEAQEDRLSMLLDLHDSGEAYFDDEALVRFEALQRGGLTDGR